MVIMLIMTLLIAAAMHKSSVSRYERLVRNYRILLDQKSEIEELFEEVTASKEKYQYLAYHDILTKLPNRIMLNQKLEELINITREYNRNIYVVYIDIDFFKHVNDTLGHDAGDQFISALANRIKEALHPDDLLGRMHGDEFVLIIPRDIDEVEVYLYLNSLKDLFENQISIKGVEINSTASMGVAVFPKDGTDAVTLTRNADIAMYKSKERGKNVIQFFYPELKEEMKKRADYIKS
jgi:diguanylate cyclase (GGDEF)-like protein